ncbi:15-hydroxyprostaglandin dehydrogenase [NAD(+)]-like [Aethina tumida]|uniref:15-hydroxyprostaglandin dehydrogenase [NAD(+)]-like n=1 Tax=Aethina tumida TaxID=116153 RepID=UPI00096B364C|nr:15-hydroxyprostaglandin dehydrogenase [NAD(+)]-like [Aethina tumida]
MVFDIKGKIALITGGATGIGLQYSVELLKNGLQGVTIADIDATKGQEAVAYLNKTFGGTKANFVKTDVTKADQLEAAFKTAVTTWKGLDIVINNAGIMNDQKWELEIAINCNAVSQGTLLGIKYMGKNNGGKGGVIVNIASILGLQELSGCPIYVGTKHFVVGLNRSFGTKYFWDLTGIKFVTMCPGVTDTPLISEAGHFALDIFPQLGTQLANELGSLPAQRPENVAKGLITLITKGDNGSVWVSEGGQPIYEVAIPDRRTIRKN